MNQAHVASEASGQRGQPIARRRCPGRATALVALAALIIAAGAFPNRTSAQQDNSTTGLAPLDRPPTVGTQPTMGGQERMQAPIGHRQPRPQDLPPGTVREEGTRTPEQRALDEKLQICRGC